MPKKTAKKPTKRTYDKPLTLAPLTFEEAVKVMLNTPPLMPNGKPKTKRAKKKTYQLALCLTALKSVGAYTPIL